VTRLPRGLRALAHRDFRIFFAGQALALVGGWVQAVAQSWLVLELTGSPLRLALINSFHFAPVLFGSLFAGAVVDRLPKRRLLVVAATAYALQALILAVLVGTGRVAYWRSRGASSSRSTPRHAWRSSPGSSAATTSAARSR
jgi:MFS family permease